MDLGEIRKALGGKVEEALNALVDAKLKDVSLDSIKAKAHEELDKLLDKHIGDLVTNLGEKLKKDVIDLIDGEDDIK